MSDTSTIRAESPGDERSPVACNEQPQVVCDLPSQLIPKNSGTETLALSAYEKRLSKLLRQQWQKSNALGYPTLALPNEIIILHNHPIFVGPVATLADSELGHSLAAWYRTTFPNDVAPRADGVFSADKLLALLTTFTRHVGNTPKTAHAQALLQAACVQTLEEFTTPTTYDFRWMEPRHYYGLRLILHYHRNHLVQDGSEGNSGRVLGHLFSWIPHRDDVTLFIRPLYGDTFQMKLSWQDACDPVSKAITFPPLLKKDKPPLLNSNAVDNNVMEGSTAVRTPDIMIL
jgi:hypothetical protein